MDGPSTSKSSCDDMAPAISVGDQNGEITDGQPEKIETPIQIFADKVSVAGLSEAYKETHKPTKYMYRLALIITFGAIIHQSYMIAIRYQGVSTVFMDEEKQVQAPFPNITVCFPANIFSTRMTELWAQVKTRKVTKLMDTYHLSLDDVQNFVRKGYMLEVGGKEMNSPVYLLAVAIINAVKEIASTQWDRMLRETAMPVCENVLSNCTFHGHKFDCCDGAQFYTILQLNCFMLNTLAIEGAVSDIDNDPMQLEQVGLVVHVKTDWTYSQLLYDDSSSDGYHIYVGIIPCPYRIPVHVPSDADVLITLDQPKRLSVITDCRDTYENSALKYYSYYDPQGMNCVGENVIDLVSNFVGCEIPMLSYIPANATCTLNQVFIAASIFSDALDEMNDELGVKLKKIAADAYKTIRDLHSEKSICLPMCNRWAYPVFSASFGSIAYKDKEEEMRQTANASWSRIRVIMPHKSHMRHSEKWISAAYLAVCDVGGMMGVYAGFSMVTFFQIIGYGIPVIWFLKKRRAVVQPVTES